MIKKILILLIIVLSSFKVFADAESGMYIVGNLGYGFVSNNTMSHPTNNNSYAIGLGVGYAFNEYFAIDTQSTLMPNNNGYSIFSNYFLSSVAFKASIPLSKFFSTYIHIGAGLLTNVNNGDNQSGLFTGLGGFFKINKSLGISAEDYGILLPNNNSGDINIFAIGIVYGF